ncbi:MAG: hypothetical protein N2201_05235, partial [candidate division WOR-3 bacterium]|nr:hypothetical protein [candidate division WOR-3 bacterium]
MKVKILSVLIILMGIGLYAQGEGLYSADTKHKELISSDFSQRNLANDNIKNLPFDSLNCRFVGNWPFGPSYAVAYDPTRNLCFLGSGGGVYILNVANPLNPINLIGQNFRTRGVVWGLFYLNNRLYIADGYAGLEIWDVTNPSSPTKLGYCDTPGKAQSVYVSGSYAYVADGTSGLRIIN